MNSENKVYQVEYEGNKALKEAIKVKNDNGIDLPGKKTHKK